MLDNALSLIQWNMHAIFIIYSYTSNWIKDKCIIFSWFMIEWMVSNFQQDFISDEIFFMKVLYMSHIFDVIFLSFMYSLALTGDRWTPMPLPSVSWPCVESSRTPCVWSHDWSNWNPLCTFLVRSWLLT